MLHMGGSRKYLHSAKGKKSNIRGHLLCGSIGWRKKRIRNECFLGMIFGGGGGVGSNAAFWN